MPSAEPPETAHEEVVSLPGGHAITLVRPRDPEALLDEGAFEAEEFLPYWAELWPSALGLARAIAPRALRGARTVELGCGLGLPSVCAALAGGRVLATDWSPEAVQYTAENARRNEISLETAVCAWKDPGPVLDRAPWDLVLASDVLYEARNVDELLALLPRLVGPRGEVWIADPGRKPAERFLAEAERDWIRTEQRPDPELPSVRLHRLRPRGGGAPERLSASALSPGRGPSPCAPPGSPGTSGDGRTGRR